MGECGQHPEKGHIMYLRGNLWAYLKTDFYAPFALLLITISEVQEKP